MKASKPVQAKASFTSTSKGDTVNAKNTKGIPPKTGMRAGGVQSKASGIFEFNHQHRHQSSLSSSIIILIVVYLLNMCINILNIFSNTLFTSIV